MHFSADQPVLLLLTRGGIVLKTPDDDGILGDAWNAWVEKYHLEPTDDDIRDMHAAIGKEPRFLELYNENKEQLFRGMLRVRRVDEMYRDLSASGTEDPDSMRAGLERFVRLAPENFGHLGAVARRWAERLGIEQGWPAQLHMVSFLNAAADVVEISRAVAGAPKIRDERHTGARRTKAETEGIVAILKKVDVNIDGETKGKSKEAWLAGAIVGYTSGKKISGEGFLKRLLRMEDADSS
jgi:hypothetical protein